MDTLDKLLGVDPDLTANTTTEQSLVPAAPAPVASVEPVREKELEDDFQFSRGNIKSMITSVEAALNSAILLAQAGDSPRAYEVVGKMLESLVTAHKELSELHRTKKETLETTTTTPLLPSGNGPVTNIGKAVFIGRASDLLRELKEIEKRQDLEAAAIEGETIDAPES